MYNVHKLTDVEIDSHTTIFGNRVVKLIADMTGLQLTLGEATVCNKRSTPENSVTVFAQFSGIVQGEYYLSTSQSNASILMDLPSDQVTQEDLTSGFLDELLNCSIGQTIEELKDTYAFLTFSSPSIVLGQLFLPEYRSAKVDLFYESGELFGECKFLINMAKVEITDKLLKTMQKLRNKTEENNIDALTQIYNRNYYNYYIEKLFGLKQPLTFAIIDIDDFKNINDSYGHINGDIALQYIARVLQKNTRNSDIPIRFGGDEFVIIFEQGTSLSADRYFKRVYKKLSSSPLVNEEGTTIPITLSVGVAEHRQREEFKDLFDRADHALYNAKELGKNQVYLSDKIVEI